ncbi:unnamed protein product [Lymnaea stagnalis]|uniref:Group XIIA secretory phospholipase A2 n=1 Tax=Lymnaea stagnalis TaxID=6523 RepID=A0AAV2IFY8_LYMST
MLAVNQHRWYHFMLLITTHVFNVNSVLTKSRDAASNTVGDILESMHNVVSNIHDYIGDKGGCIFKCPNGVKPQKNPDHTKSSNGCGAFGFKLDSHIQIKDVTNCCDDHDFCYDTCNESKESCDKSFKKCLTKVCKRIEKHVSNVGYEGCLSTADLIYAATVALGCKPYKDAQAKACICKRKKIEL